MKIEMIIMLMTMLMTLIDKRVLAKMEGRGRDRSKLFRYNTGLLVVMPFRT